MTTTTLAPAPIATFTAPDQYIGLPDFWQALEAWAWAAQFGEQGRRMWAGMRLHSQQVKAANACTVEQMKAVEAVPFGETPDVEDRIEALGFPLLKHWLNDPEVYARLHQQRSAGWAEYRKAMKGEK